MTRASCVKVFVPSEKRSHDSMVGIVTTTDGTCVPAPSGANKIGWIYISILPYGFMTSIGTGFL